MGLKKIDDYTVSFTFAIPYPTAVEKTLTAIPSRDMIWPAHFLKQYLPKYNPDAATLAIKEGQETWQLAVAYHRQPARDTMAPTLAPFILKEVTSTSALWVRNPYYWRVDPAGNQLPYVDTILASILQDWSGVPTKVMAGEVDIAAEGLQLADYPVLKQNEAQGKYKVYLRSDLDTSTALGFALNYTVKDPVLKQIFNDLRFRQALSLAINRDDISQTIFFGKTVPFTAPVSSYWPGYEDWEGTYYAEHDVAKANALLDDMGLKWDSAHQYRLRPDGKPLTILGEWSYDWLGYVPDFMQIMVQNWADIGVKLDPKFVREDTLNARWAANLQDVGISNSEGGNVSLAHSNYPIRLEPPWHWMGTDCCAMSSYPWRLWLDTNGKQGEEPPQQIKDLYKLVNQWLATPTDKPEFTTLMNQIIKINVNNLYYFGTVSAPPTVSINNNRVGNLPPLDGLPGALADRSWMNETIFIRP
jgi:peptide/nickel transport system substrate-binding protein